MKLRSSGSMLVSLLMLAGAWSPTWNGIFAATLSVSPSAVSSSYNGLLTLQVGGLINGEGVQIRKYADGNTNGIVDASDVLVQSFRLVDGQAFVIGGVTNINVPGDYTPTNGTIVAPLNFRSGGIGQVLAGQYAYVLSSPGGNFTPVTNLFNVTNAAQAQSFTGTVVSGGTNVPYANVLLFTPPVEDGGMEFVAGSLANSSGSYRVAAPAGNYFLLVTRNGYVADLSQAPVLTLGAGATLNTNLSLVAATRTASGRVVDTVNTNQGLGALLVVCESSSALTIGFTDTNGNFTVPVTAGQWLFGTDDEQLAFYGYLRPNGETNVVDTTAGNVSGVSVALPRCTALIHGSVKDVQNVPLAGIRLNGNQDFYSGPYEANATTDLNGNYVLGVLAGSWQADVEDSGLVHTNYIFSRMSPANLSAGQAVLHNFVGILATNYITGLVRDGGGNPIANLGVYAQANINSADFDNYVNTDASGAFSFNAANGTWRVGLDCNHLNSLGLTCPPEKSTNVLNANVVMNFVASNLRITTTTLPTATMGVLYSQALTASGGQMPYTWSLSPGFTNVVSLLGLSLAANGVLSGTPTGSGSTFFGVRVTDNQGAWVEQFLNLDVNPAPLQITTTSLPPGTNGQFYYQNLNVTGGNPPYNWYLPSGTLNLPPGLNLNANGILSGTPTTNGVFNFNVSVYVNNPYQVTTQLLSLTVAVAPLQITTTSPLPTATRNSFYTTTLLATGGQPPYTWSVAPGSPGLPSGLFLSPGGLLSGTPTVAGGFSFIARVTDLAQRTNDWTLGLSINEPAPAGLVLTGASLVTPGQFQFSFNTGVGTNYTVQSCTDLKTWGPVLTFGGTGGPLTFTDPSASVGTRFFRVKIGP